MLNVTLRDISLGHLFRDAAVSTSGSWRLLSGQYLANGWQHCSKAELEELVLQRHIRLGLQANAGAEDVRERCTLFAEGIDDRSPGRGKRRLKGWSA